MRYRSLFALVVSLFVANINFAQNGPTGPTPAQAKGYRIWPGDEVSGKVIGEPDFDFVATVTEEGNIVLPFDSTHPIAAKCRTEAEMSTEISRMLGKYLRNPLLSFRVTDRKSRPPATISGEVNTPQQVILYRKVTLLEMLSVAGGVKEEASGTIQVFRTQPPMCDDDKLGTWVTDDPSGVPSKVFNIADVKVARNDANPVIYPGDVIMVQRAAPVYITGEVNNPQGVYIKEGGLSLYEAVAKIGGPNRQAKTKDIKIYRRKTDSTFEVLNANFDLIKKGQQKDIMLQPYDVVEVDKSKDSMAMAIMKIALGAGKTLISSGANSIGYKVLY